MRLALIPATTPVGAIQFRLTPFLTKSLEIFNNSSETLNSGRMTSEHMAHSDINRIDFQSGAQGGGGIWEYRTSRPQGVLPSRKTRRILSPNCLHSASQETPPAPFDNPRNAKRASRSLQGVERNCTSKVMKAGHRQHPLQRQIQRLVDNHALEAAVPRDHRESTANMKSGPPSHP
jgi:hypothetical protein